MEMKQVDQNRWVIPKSMVKHDASVGEVISDGNLTMVGEGDWRKTGLRIDEITEHEYIGILVEV